MDGLITRLFDYDREMGSLESEIYDRPNQMDVVFNYIDLAFQLMPASNDEAYSKHAKYLKTLLRYYDKKSFLNMGHSEKVVDGFRYCIRKCPYLCHIKRWF